MAARASQCLVEIADALPLAAGMHILAVGCGPGVLARLIDGVPFGQVIR